MSDNKTIDNVHVEIYGHEMLSEVITRARKNNIPYDKEMQYDFHAHGHSYLVLKDGEITLLEDPSEKHGEEISLNGFFELYLSKEEVQKVLEIGKWYKYNRAILNYQGVKDSLLQAYGVVGDGSWLDTDNCGYTPHEWSESTPQEVEQALIEEAKGRYKVGDFIKPLVPSINQWAHLEIKSDCTTYDIPKNRLYYGGWLVFNKGQWATIIEQDKFAELKEAYKNGAVIEFRSKYTNFEWEVTLNPAWGDFSEYRIKPEEALEIGDKVIGIRTDCAIVGEVTSVAKKKVCVNNLAFLKDQVSLLSSVQYDDVRSLINGLKGYD